MPGALHVEGGWYAILKAPQIKSDEDWALAVLEQDAVLVQPGYYYDFPNSVQLVLSLLTEEADFCEALKRIRARFLLQ